MAIVNIASLAARGWYRVVGELCGDHGRAAHGRTWLCEDPRIMCHPGERGVTGAINTTMTTGADYSAAAADIPLGRLGEVGDVSGVIVFLTSDDARYAAGQGIDVNGRTYMS